MGTTSELFSDAALQLTVSLALQKATAPTAPSTLSLHDALPIFPNCPLKARAKLEALEKPEASATSAMGRFERSEEHTSELHHVAISYAVFCLKKKNKHKRKYDLMTAEDTE